MGFFFEVVNSIINSFRLSLRTLYENDTKTPIGQLLIPYRFKHFEEFECKCQDILSIICQQLLPDSTDPAIQVTLLRYQADLYRK